MILGRQKWARWVIWILDIGYKPLSTTPSEDCNGLALKYLMVVGERVSDEKIEAAIVLTQGMPYENAPDICSEQNMIWMKELDYTQRVITTLKSGHIINDFTFDLSQCRRWQEIAAYSPDSDERSGPEEKLLSD
jgi:hypothetical protein